MLLPYKGSRRREHFGPDGKGAYTTTTYGLDKAEAKTYYFNSLGFRGEEFDPDAPLKLFVCGCSNSFGVGVELEETWAYLFKEKLAESRGLEGSSVNLMNFSQGGASNDYIARTLVEQSARVRPDVIVAGFTHSQRFELLDHEMSFTFGAVDFKEYARQGGHYAELQRLGEFLFLGADDIQKKLRAIRNILLVQYFCRSREIPFVFFLFESLRRDDLPAALSTPATQALFEEIDLDALAPIEPDIRVDRAADGLHPGPRSQELLADVAWKTFSARYG
jgi:hypothetical protein